MVLGDLATQRATRRMRLPPLSVGGGPGAGRRAGRGRRRTAPGHRRQPVLRERDPRRRVALGAAHRPRRGRGPAGPGQRRHPAGGGGRGGHRGPGGPVAAGVGPGGLAGLGRRVPGHRDPGPGRDRAAVPARAGPDGRRGSVSRRTGRPSCTRACWPALEAGDADPAVLAHHAEGAGDEQAVLRHAPEAARRSAALGAHREAAAQFERALRMRARSRQGRSLAALHEGVAGEYSLLDRWEEAEQALRTPWRCGGAGRRA